MTKTEKTLLFLIILIGLLLRFYNLTFQSLWLDELHTMIETDPKISFKELLNYLSCCDLHPPLFFFLERLSFSIFGHSEWIARSLTAIAGTTSIWAIFLLGRELYNTKTGLTVAAFTCVNYYSIYYSQEARGYILAFLFASLSFLYLVRLVKNLNRKNTLLFSLFTLLMMFTHYYGIFVTIAEAFILMSFWLLEKEKKTLLFKHILGSFILIGLIYASWTPYIMDMKLIKSFWITNVSSNFATDYFFEYFGNSDLLKPFLYLFLMGFFVQLFSIKGNLKEQPFFFGFFILVAWIFITYLIPYLRSIFVIPMLHPRYTIVVLPAILLIIASGVQNIQNQVIRNMLIGVFIFISLLDIISLKKYYSQPNKTQFREITAYIANHNELKLPIINPKTAWHFQYYAKSNKIENQLLGENTDHLIDSFIQSKVTKGFWLVGSHNNPPKLTEEQQKSISSNYIQTIDLNYFDSWLQQYISTNSLSDKYSAVFFHPSLSFNIDKQDFVVLWGSKMASEVLTLKKGKYSLKLFSKGTSVNGEYPKINILVNQKKLAEYIPKPQIEQVDFTFETDGSPTHFVFEMTNDFTAQGEDRNFFIQKAFVLRLD
jgi:uncharacterized membrane protein